MSSFLEVKIRGLLSFLFHQPSADFDHWTRGSMYLLEHIFIAMGVFAYHLKTAGKSSVQELVQKFAFG